jgi:DNA methylase
MTDGPILSLPRTRVRGMSSNISKRTRRDPSSEAALVAFPNAAFNERGLLIDPSCSYDEWQRMGADLERISGAWQWWYGDWWNFGESRYGEKHAQALPDKDYGTKANAAYVASRVQFSRRREISFAHHQEVAPLEPSEQDAWLEQAIAEEWGHKELRHAIKRAKELVPRTSGTLPKGDHETEGVHVLFGDFRQRLLEIEPGSIDLIITDPPYPKEDLPLWYDLGQVAAKLLTPRGLLIAYSGQLFLPDVIGMLGESLTYGWTFALMLPGSGSRIMGRHMIQGWKPVVAFSTGTWPSGEWADDVLTSPDREKDDYEWQQNAAPAIRLIERFTPPNGIVLDPFLGVGSFGIAAKTTGRRFIGVELDQGRFDIAVERIEASHDTP